MHLVPLFMLAMTNGEESSFLQTLYIEHRQLMYRTALQYVHNLHDAEDVVNSACEALLKDLRRLREVEPQALPAYILSTVQNQARAFLTQQERESRALERLFSDQEPDSASAVSDEVVYQFTLHELRELVRQLSPEDQQILKMKYFDRMENSDIAHFLGIAESSVRSRLSRARQRLHALMKEANQDVL